MLDLFSSAARKRGEKEEKKWSSSFQKGARREKERRDAPRMNSALRARWTDRERKKEEKRRRGSIRKKKKGWREV